MLRTRTGGGVMVADFLIDENEHFSSRQAQRVCHGFICSIENCNSAISHRIHAWLFWAFSKNTSGCPGAGRRLSGQQYG
jgi:hypothetical protein